MLLIMKKISLKITMCIQTLKGIGVCIVLCTAKHEQCIKYIYNLIFYHSGLQKIMVHPKLVMPRCILSISMH